MKTTITVTLLFLTAWASYGQTKVKPKTAPSKPIATPLVQEPALKTLADSASYALGNNIAHNLKNDLGDLNTNLLIRAMQDVFNNGKSLLTEEIAYSVLSSYSEKVQKEKSEAVVKAGQAFLEKNKARAEVKTTASGLQYEVIKEGSGAKPTAADSVTVHYRGTLTDGTEFDASYNRNEPLTIQLGQVIPGWTEGVQLMTVGSKYKFYVPYELGYGLRGAQPTIPGGSALIFEIELLKISKAANP
jgi:FKBP-type peptidyl-prolyl cis-trans isomerase FklB